MPSDTAKQDSTGSNDPAVRLYRPQPDAATAPAATAVVAGEVGGRRDGTEPTRFGDWEKAGRCIDF
jgi:hypothetical protein